jgi:hypothetical protein
MLLQCLSTFGNAKSLQNEIVKTALGPLAGLQCRALHSLSLFPLALFFCINQSTYLLSSPNLLVNQIYIYGQWRIQGKQNSRMPAHDNDSNNNNTILSYKYHY